MDVIFSEPNEQKYQRLEKLGQRLGVPVFGSHLQLEVFKGGKRIYGHKQRSHSWNRNAYNWMMSQLGGRHGNAVAFGAGGLSVLTTSGTHRTGGRPIGIGARDVSSTSTLDRMFNVESPTLNTRALVGGAGESDRGIVVGSGNAAENFDGYSLDALITNGTGAGQLEHTAQSIATAYADLTLQVIHTRFFNNNSGGSVNINETGIVTLIATGASTYASDRMLITRDLLPSTINLPDTGQLKVTYTIELVYPE